MEKAIFAELIGDLCSYYERKPPNPPVLEIWYGKLKDFSIPLDALTSLRNKLTEGDTFPRNLPEAIRQKFNEWLSANPSRRAFTEEPGCQNCHAGFLTLAWKDKDLGWYETCFRCAHCNGGPGGIPARTLSQIMVKGIYHKPYKTVHYAYHRHFPEIPQEEWRKTREPASRRPLGPTGTPDGMKPIAETIQQVMEDLPF